VGFQEQLARSLTERLDLLFNSLTHHRVALLVEVNGALVREIVEHVCRPDCLWPLLLVAEDQVDPLVELARDKLRLESLSVDPDKLLGTVCPRRQLDVVHLGPVVQSAKSVVGAVDEHLWQVIELWDQLLHIACVPLTVGPAGPHAAEQPVGMVELASLQCEEHAGEGLEPDQVVEGEGRGGVVRSVVERGDLVVLPRVVPRLEVFPSRLVQSSNGLAQVSEVVWRAQVQFRAVIVGDDPREHRVLVQVIVRPAGDGVEEHEVLKVGDLPPLPLLGHV